jgi:lysophosphatidylcholine acyltransferase / lyso-PAF acetyltransferase
MPSKHQRRVTAQSFSASLQFLGVAARVKERMQQVSAGEGPHRRPILLFPEGTTTNGRYMLRFRTGGFIAGVPVQPIILKYGRVRQNFSYTVTPEPCNLHVSRAGARM